MTNYISALGSAFFAWYNIKKHYISECSDTVSDKNYRQKLYEEFHIASE